MYPPGRWVRYTLALSARLDAKAMAILEYVVRKTRPVQLRGESLRQGRTPERVTTPLKDRDHSQVASSEGAPSQRLLQDYTDVRIGFGVPIDPSERDVARSLQIQNRLWQQPVAVTAANPSRCLPVVSSPH
jgi:hypothetical protein